ncbi:EAL domain-containing protein [Thiorhodospira sibirica]|uniref:sensor domain-containing protein n=1 Tax=Thiorhodospira sibirica TaxID=154347 RepID=UPI00022C2844|nr:EAL domain-containing protein [Thiorhodospira sibirica]
MIPKKQQALSTEDTEELKALGERALIMLRNGDVSLAEEMLNHGDVSLAELVENLRVHQAELEIQNEELRAARLQQQYAFERFSTLFNLAPMPMLVMDRTGLILEGNRAAANVFGLENRHLRQHFFRALIRPEDQARALGGFSVASAHGEAHITELHFVLGAGQGFLGDLHIASLPAAQRLDVWSFICVVMDQSDQIRQREIISDAERANRIIAEKLTERLKEIRFLQYVTEQLQHTEQIDIALLQRVVDELPSAMRFSHDISARIRLNHDEVSTANFKHGAANIRTRIRLNHPHKGLIEVCYLADPAHEPPFDFLPEEQDLIQTLAGILGNALEREHAQRERDQIFATSVDMMCVAGFDGYLKQLNPAWQRTLGWTETQMTEKPWLDFVHPEDVANTLMALDALKTGQTVLEFENRYRCRDGTYRWLAWNSYPDIPNQRLFAVVRDITERKLHEDALRQAATVFENTRDGVIITDLQPRILGVNRAYTDITGYTHDEVFGLNPRILQSERHHKAFYQAMWRSIKDNGYWQGEIWNRRKSGEIYPEWLTISTVRNADGQPTHYVGVFTDISRLKKTEARLEHLAHHDPLTDLPNRLLFLSRVQHALASARRRKEKIAVLFLDLDRFKTVNDSLGHPSGDELLVAIAKQIGARLHSEDTLARLGGDEFLILLESVERAHQAADIAQDLLETLEAPFTLGSGHEVYIGASIGISVYPDDAHGETELIQHADAAMYKAKDQGRNSFHFYTQEMTQAAIERLELETAIRRGLEQNEFVLHYQPLIDLRTEKTVGFEALIRWQHPQKGLIYPAAFIPAAEETGLILALGKWVLHTACTQCRRWLDEGIAPAFVAVNLSARQFQGQEIDQQVREALDRTGLPGHYLELELTETMVLEPGETAAQKLATLKTLGIQLAIDDFGTGYSSLAYLKRLPINKLKIDRSFISNMIEDEDDQQLVSTIINMAHNLRLSVLSEGVETQAQAELLKQMGCDFAQGYFYSKPQPAEYATARLRAMS